MKVWSAVMMHDGIIQDMAVLPNMEAARNCFIDFIYSNGEIDDCDPDAYMDGNTEGAKEFFYWWNNDDAEITIWPVDFEMEMEHGK